VPLHIRLAAQPKPALERVRLTMVKAVPKIKSVHRAFHRAWGRVRWKMAAIIILTGSSTLLFAGIFVATVHVVVRREAANIAEKQIQTLVQASRSIASAALENVEGCRQERVNSGGLKSLLTYTSEEFPAARVSLRMEDRQGAQLLPPHMNASDVTKPNWLTHRDFTGLVADNGRLEIRNLAERNLGGCTVTAIFQVPLGAEVARRLSAAADFEIKPVRQRVFRVHGPMQRIFRTIDSNFVPGAVAPVGVVLTVRDWNTGAREDWIAYTVQSDLTRTFDDIAMLGSQRANWVWLLAVLSLAILLLYASGVWIGIRLSQNIVRAINDLSHGAEQIVVGNLDYRTPVHRDDQLSGLARGFNNMAAGLKRLQQEELARQRLENEMDLARKVQNHLYPRSAPQLEGATVSGRTQPARLIGGDLYDFFDLGTERLGLLCADVSGKGVSAALMMANLQAIARAHCGSNLLPPAQFVDVLNHELAGRFGDNRYATLFWGAFDARTQKLQYVNAGNPSAILIRPGGRVERLVSDGFPIGMFGNAKYSHQEVFLEAGAALIIFSDGLTDAVNVRGEEFGDERLVEYCQQIGRGAESPMEATEIAEILTHAVAEWSDGVEHFDDTTLVVVAVADRLRKE
jgi:serine phosphatase RsbU (regulator of sigma subunit)